MNFPARGSNPTLKLPSALYSYDVEDEIIRKFIEESTVAVRSQLLRSIALNCLKIDTIEIIPDGHWHAYDLDLIENAKQLKRSTTLKSLSLFEANLFSLVLNKLNAAHIPWECLELSCFKSGQKLA